MKKSFLFLFCFFVLLFLFTGPLFAQEIETRTLDHDGLARTYELYIPEDYSEAVPVPLMIVLHGAGGDGRGIANGVGFNALADEEGFIVAYPDAIGARWSYLDVPIDAQDSMADDLGYINALIDTLSIEYVINENRVYIVGFSNGGIMAGRLRCDADDRIAGVMVVAATMTFGISQTCLDAAPMPFALILGTEDQVFPLTGILQVENGMMYGSFSVPQTLSFMGSLNGCSLTQQAAQISAEGSPVRVFKQMPQCPPTAPVVFYGILAGDHRWPGGLNILDADGQIITMEAEIWRFLSAYERG